MKVFITKEKLKDLYINNKLTIRQTAVELDVNPKTISRYLDIFELKRSRSEAKKVYYSKHTIWNKGIARIKPNFEPSISLAYILGVLKGDGTVTDKKRSRIYMDQSEEKFAKSFEEALKKINLKPVTYFLGDRKQYRTQTQSLSFYTWYKSLTLKEIDKIVSKRLEFIMAFVRGFYESEGLSCIDKYKKTGWIRWRLMIFNSNMQLLREVQDFIRILGFSFRFGIQRKKTALYKIKGHFGFSTKPSYYLESANKSQNYDFIKFISPCIKNKVTIPQNEILKRERLGWIADYTNKRFKTVKELCEHYNIPQKRFYRWLKRYKNNGVEGLVNLNYLPK